MVKVHLCVCPSCLFMHGKGRWESFGKWPQKACCAYEVIFNSRYVIWCETKAFFFNLCRDVPTYKQRIAGKSLPTEKFVIKKSTRFFAQGERLRLAALELLYVWNLLKIVGKEWDLIQSCYRVIERTLREIEANKQGLIMSFTRLN